jgi:uncharacterized membrane protein
MSFGAPPEGIEAAVAAAHTEASLTAFGVVMVVIGACSLAVGALVARLLLTKGGWRKARQ